VDSLAEERIPVASTAIANTTAKRIARTIVVARWTCGAREAAATSNFCPINFSHCNQLAPRLSTPTEENVVPLYKTHKKFLKQREVARSKQSTRTLSTLIE
jgi:hypothetical protein